MKRIISFTGVVLCASSLWSCDGKDTARAVWKEVMKRCAPSDLLGKKVLFLGISGGWGPGAVVRVAGTGGYAFRFDGSESGIPHAQLVKENDSSTCSVDQAYSSKLAPSIDVEAVVSPITGEAKADISRASKITVIVESWRWDDLREPAFEAAYKDNSMAEPMRKDLASGNRFVVRRALWIAKASAKLDYSSATGVDIKAKYAPAGDAGVKIGAGVAAKWTSDGKLTIEITTGRYLAAELDEFSPNGFKEAGGKLLREANLDLSTATSVVKEAP